jgi:hypothetical protein
MRFLTALAQLSGQGFGLTFLRLSPSSNTTPAACLNRYTEPPELPVRRHTECRPQDSAMHPDSPGSGVCNVR